MLTSPQAVGVPRIRRARGYRLYDVQGKRYLDLFREGALLGHRGEAALTAMKSALSQGLATSLPSAWEGRLVAALAQMFPAYRSVRLYSSRERALEAVSLYL
jgi:glutamate-1-semialdehyde aminotransferase